MKMIFSMAAFLPLVALGAVPNLPSDQNAPVNQVLTQAKKDASVVALISFNVQPSQTKTVCQATSREEQTATIVFVDNQNRPIEAKYILCDGAKANVSSFVIPEETPGANLRVLPIDFNLKEVVDTKVYEDNDCDVSRSGEDFICLESNYRVFNWDVSELNANPPGTSKITNVSVDSAKPNCLKVSYQIVGSGYDKVGDVKVNCKGHGKVTAKIKAVGYTTSEKALME